MNEERLISVLRAAFSDHDTKGFNVLDFIHALGSGREALLYAGLFWPDFAEFENMVFLKSTVEDEDDKRRIQEALRAYDHDLTKTEQSFNVIEIANLFGRRAGETGEEEDRLLAELIAQTWGCRLRTTFPDRHFEIKISLVSHGRLNRRQNPGVSSKTEGSTEEGR